MWDMRWTAVELQRLAREIEDGTMILRSVACKATHFNTRVSVELQLSFTKEVQGSPEAHAPTNGEATKVAVFLGGVLQALVGFEDGREALGFAHGVRFLNVNSARTYVLPVQMDIVELFESAEAVAEIRTRLQCGGAAGGATEGKASDERQGGGS